MRQADSCASSKTGAPRCAARRSRSLPRRVSCPTPATRAVVARAARTARSRRPTSRRGPTPSRCCASSGRRRTKRCCASSSSPREPEAVQAAAIEALGRAAGRRASAASCWSAGRRSRPPARRAAAHALIADRDAHAAAARRAVEGHGAAVDAGLLGEARPRHARRPGDSAASRARCSKSVPAEREAVVARYAAALDLAGDAARGREVFTRVCAACHRRETAGTQDIGPDLATVRHRPLSALLDRHPRARAARSRSATRPTWSSARTAAPRPACSVRETPTSVTLRRARSRHRHRPRATSRRCASCRSRQCRPISIGSSIPTDGRPAAFHRRWQVGQARLKAAPNVRDRGGATVHRCTSASGAGAKVPVHRCWCNVSLQVCDALGPTPSPRLRGEGWGEGFSCQSFGRSGAAEGRALRT